ncbi:hypothetical protein CR513_58120, partial [Mucuna pruriens]
MVFPLIRLLGWWSIDEGSREEEARLFCAGSPGYNTFTPDTVKKMPRSDLVEEIWRLQAALGEQTQVTKYSQEERRYYVGFASKSRLTWSYFPADITFFAALAAKSVKGALSAVAPLKKGCLYMMCRLSSM